MRIDPATLATMLGMAVASVMAPDSRGGGFSV
jgi:hypothetical protein